MVLVLAAAFTAVATGAGGLAGIETSVPNEPVTLRYCVDPDWPPYEVISDAGTHDGIAGDLIRLVAARSNVGLELVPTADWDASLAAAKAGTCEALSFLNQSPGRDEWLVFTDPVFVDPNVIVTREDHGFINDLAAVNRETMVLPKGTSVEERVRRDFPNLNIVLTESEAEAFAMVADRRADMTMRSMVVAVHTIKKNGWFNLKISGRVDGYENKLRIGVAKARADLRDRLNLGVRTLTPVEREEIANRHVSITVKRIVDWEVLTRFLVPAAAILLTSVFWILRLRRTNRELAVLSRTDALTGLTNRAAATRRLEEEIGRATRHGRPLSVILFDLDNFKSINDHFGHAAGDEVLRRFAELLGRVARGGDVTARWGGEEFLIICPETDEAGAARAAERVVTTMRALDFGDGRRHTVSAGVAAHRAGEGIDAWLHRADEALYRSKAAGRDRVGS